MIPNLGIPNIKPHLSPSQLETYATCPERWRRRYIEHEKIPPGMAMIVGRVVHHGAGANMNQKKTTREDLPVKEVVDIVAAQFDAEVAGGYVLDAEESTRGPKAVIGATKDASVELAGYHMRVQAPDYQPLMTEERFRIELPMCSHDMVGVIDLATEFQGTHHVISDFKNSSKAKKQADVDSSIQLTTYAAAYQGLTGSPVAHVQLDTIVRKKKGPERNVVASLRGPRDFATLSARIDVTTKAIATGIFPPTHPGNWACSLKWCGYARTCAYFNAEHDRRETKEDE